MLLVDSSVWIDVIRGGITQGASFLEQRDDEELAVTGIVFQEVLQGVNDDRIFEDLRNKFLGMLLLEPRELSTYEIAAQLFRRARGSGFTIRKPADCLIAALALEHGALLVHNDRDFIFLSQVEPSLLVFPGPPH